MSECQTGASCNCPHCGQEECCCSMAKEMLSLAKCAKHDLLKEKMKKLIETKIGKRLDEVAEVAVDAVIAKMEHKTARQQACEEYEDDLMTAWSK